MKYPFCFIHHEQFHSTPTGNEAPYEYEYLEYKRKQRSHNHLKYLPKRYVTEQFKQHKAEIVQGTLSGETEVNLTGKNYQYTLLNLPENPIVKRFLK